MSHLDPERLALIAIENSTTDAERDHLASCDACSIELAELEHTVTIGRSTLNLGVLESPPERVWEAVLSEVRAQSEGTGDTRDTGGLEHASPTTGAAPAAEPVAAGSVATESAASGPDTTAAEPAVRGRKRRGLSRLLLTLAASIAAVVVVVGAWNLTRPPESVEIASASLAAFPDHPGAAGAALVTELPNGERTVTVNLDAAAGEGFREVWLITADASALVSLGELEGSEGTFVVPDDIDLRDYVLVDVSQEPLDGDPTHSGDSIVRGELDFG